MLSVVCEVSSLRNCTQIGVFSLFQVGIYCLCLVAPNGLPKVGFHIN